MSKKNYDELNYWQRLEAEETERERTDKRLNYLIYAGLAGIIIVALFGLF